MSRSVRWMRLPVLLRNADVRTAFITGIGGQDGSYLCELLLTKGYRVIGIGHGSAGCYSRISHVRDSVTLVDADLLDQSSLERALERYRPQELYNFAAYHPASSQSQQDPLLIADVNGMAVVRILEAIRKTDSTIRMCQASTSQMYGHTAAASQDENTPFQPANPYSIAKLYAHWNVVHYRHRYGLHACSAILFNHESPRRSEKFVTRKITLAAARIRAGMQHCLELNDLDACRDWGYAPDYVWAMWRMLQQDAADDYVLATGEIHPVREFCRIAFARAGLDFEQYVSQTTLAPPSQGSIYSAGNPGKAQQRLGWRHTLTFEEIVCDMVDADMALITSTSPRQRHRPGL